MRHETRVVTGWPLEWLGIVMQRWPTKASTGQCCHKGGSIHFGSRITPVPPSGPVLQITLHPLLSSHRLPRPSCTSSNLFAIHLPSSDVPIYLCGFGVSWCRILKRVHFLLLCEADHWSPRVLKWKTFILLLIFSVCIHFIINISSGCSLVVQLLLMCFWYSSPLVLRRKWSLMMTCTYLSMKSAYILAEEVSFFFSISSYDAFTSPLFISLVLHSWNKTYPFKWCKTESSVINIF